MKERLITAGIGVALLLVVFLALPKVCIAIFMAILCGLAVYELVTSTKLVKNMRTAIYCAVFAAFVPIWAYVDTNGTVGAIGIFAFALLMFGEAVLARGEVSYKNTASAVALAVVVPYLLSGIVRLSLLKCGRSYALLPLVIAFLCDTGAMLIGANFGKHKLLPEVSPKKTVEGAIGGLVVSVVAAVIYGVIIQALAGHAVHFVPLVICALLGAAASQVGDLTFSLIKRQSGLKDYSNFLRGHGGIMDRFDSVCFTVAMVELIVAIAPVFTTTSLI